MSTPMKRVLLALALMSPQPLAAWQMTSSPICTLSHSEDDADIVVTYDPRIPEYRLVITLSTGAWDDSATFGMAFTGPRGLQIGTDRHALDPQRRSLSVTDRGFGNVLDGLEFNETASAATMGTQTSFDLTDAAPAVRAFRDCTRGRAATS